MSFSTAGHDITFHLTLSVVKFVLILISFVLSIMPDRTPHYDLLDSDWVCTNNLAALYGTSTLYLESVS